MKKLAAAVFVGAVSISMIATGCGGGGGGSCGASACGGDLVGSWAISELCMSGDGPPIVIDDCPGATAVIKGIAETGTLGFMATTYTLSLGLTVTASYTYPAACLEGAPCSLLQAGFEAQAEVQSASCTGSTTCNCDVTFLPMSESESGTYTVAGNTLTTTADDGSPAETIDYCVKGDTAHFIDSDPDLGRLEHVADRQ